MTGQDLKAEMLLSSWTDISTYVYQRDTVTIQRGRQNEAATMQPCQATLTLNNAGGRFTTRNPAGAYYPNLVQNTPLRLSVPVADAGLSNYLRLEGDRTSGVTTPDKAGLQITGPIDVRVDLWPSDYNGNILAAKWGATAKSWLFTIDAMNWNHPNLLVPLYGETIATGTLGWYWFDGSNAQFLRANQLLPYYGQRIALRCVFTPATGTATFYTAPTMAGSWTQLGTTQTFGATTLSSGVGQAVQVGGGPIIPWTPAQDAQQLTFNSALGMIYEAQVLNNVTLEVDPVFSSQTAGVTSFTDSQSSLWTLNGTSEISSRLYRFHGEMTSFPKAADPSATDVYSQAAAAGITKRLQNSNTPLQSPMRRAYVRLPASLNLAAYWPCEDGNTATTIGSAIGGTPMQINGSPTLASNSDFKCSAPLPVINTGFFSGTVTTPAGVTWTDNAVRFLWEVPAGGETNNSAVLTYTTAGTGGYVTLVYTTGGFLNMSAYTGIGGTLLHSTGNVSFGVNGQQLRVACDMRANGGNVDMMITVHVVNAALSQAFTASAAFAGTIGAVRNINLGGPGFSASVLGHLSAQGTWSSLDDTAGPLSAWNSEPAATRIARLCTEEGIQCRIKGPPGLSMPMTYQGIDTLMNLLQACENTDLGFLYEPRECLGIGYRTVQSLYSQPPLCTVSYSSAHIYQGFASTGDTQLVVNDVTASAPSGSTYRAVLSKGAMSTLTPPSGIGRVDTAISPQPQADASLANIATWYLWWRSFDDDRYPVIPFQMPRSETPSSVALLDVGDYLKITGTPSWLPPPPVRQLCAGFAETYFPAALWEIGVNGIPEGPYEIPVVQTSAGVTDYIDTAGSTTAGTMTTVATTFTTAAASSIWTNTITGTLNIIMDGEVMTVSSITGASIPQTFTVTRSVNGVVKTHSAGASFSLARKPVIGL